VSPCLSFSLLTFPLSFFWSFSLYLSCLLFLLFIFSPVFLFSFCFYNSLYLFFFLSLCVSLF
jgi:hypothetical protein